MKIFLLLFIILMILAPLVKAQLQVSPDSLVYETQATYGDYCYKHRFVYTVTNANPNTTVTFKFTFPPGNLTQNVRLVKANQPSANLNNGDYLDTTITYQTPFSFRIDMDQNTNFKPAGTYQQN